MTAFIELICLLRPQVNKSRGLSERSIPDRVQQLVGGLDLGHVTGVGEELEPRTRDGGREGASVVGVDDLVAVTAQHLHRRLRGRKASDEAGVGHRCPGVGGQRSPVTSRDGLRRFRQRGGIDPERLRIVEAELEHLIQGQGEEVRDRVAGDVYPHGVDEDYVADAPRLQEGHLSSDPAADGVADDGDVAQITLVQQGNVEPGELADGAERLGPRGAPEAGMDRADDPGWPAVGEQLSEAGDRVWPAASVQEQERPALALLTDGDVNVADTVELHAMDGGGGHDVSLVVEDRRYWAKSVAGTVA